MRVFKYQSLVLVSSSIFFACGISANAGEIKTGQELADKVSNRASSEGRVGEMTFTLTNKKGRTRERTALLFQRDTPESIQIALHFIKPAMIEETAFLSHDNEASSEQDATWLYLPTTEKVRRLPSSDRGDAFMGTDMSYGDVKDDFKFSLEDYNFELAGETQFQNRRAYLLKGTASSSAIIDETGYSKFEATITEDSFFPVEITYFDEKGAPLKSSTVEALENIDGVWTATKFLVKNLQTEHSTSISLKDVQSVEDLSADIFDPSQLDIGMPELP